VVIRKQTLGKRLVGVLPILAILLLWQLSAVGGWIRSDNWPSVSHIALAFLREVHRGDVVSALGETAELVILGFFIGSIGGVSAAFIATMHSTLRAGLTAIVELLRPIPVPALIPPLVLLFGTELRMKLIVVSFSVLFPVFLNTAAGITNLDPQLRIVARTLHMRPLAILCDIILPAASPSIFSGLRIGLGVGLVVAVTAEIIVGGAGIGHYLLMMQFATRPAEMYGAVLALLGVGYALNLPLKKIEAACVFWRDTDRS